MIRVNKGFLGEEIETYAQAASHLLHEHHELVDCSLGVNPYGISSKVTDHLNEFELSHIHHYPESNETLKEVLLSYWEPVVHLEKSQVQFTHGAMGACELVNKILLNTESRVLGYCPQFTDYIFDVEKCGAHYEHVDLRPEDNYKFDTARFLDRMEASIDVIYLDNPNNPTGQVLPLESVEAIVRKAQTLDIACIIDEAYGDYMSDMNSAARLVNTYDNLFVIRSFSKAFGMAGLRVGYVILPKPLVRFFLKVTIPFPINSLGQFFTQFILEDRAFIIDSVKKIAEANRQIRAEVRHLKILKTSDESPIMTLMHPDPEGNLFEAFLQEGILTNSCTSYVALDQRSVRLRVPREIDRVLEAIRKIESRCSQA